MIFRFRLETLLTVRRALEEQAQLHLGQQVRILRGHVERHTELEEERLAFIAHLEREKKQVMTAARYIFIMEAVRAKERELAQQLNAIASQTEIVEQARLELAEKVRGRKVLEKLREKKFAQFRQAELAKEQVENDEMAVLRYGR